MAWRQMRGLYNGAALQGGMSMSEAANALFGGWDTASTTMPVNGGLTALATSTAQRYNIPIENINAMLQDIYTYDTYLASGDPLQAAEHKRALVDQYGDNVLKKLAYQKLWNYLRTKVHRGASKRPKISKARREEMKTAAALRARERAQFLSLADTPWFGSDPWNKQGKSSGRYVGLSAYSRPTDYVPTIDTPAYSTLFARPAAPVSEMS